MVKLDRRRLLGSVGCAGAALALPSRAMAHPLDIGDPVDRLRAIIRLRGSETTPFWLLIQGQVYGRAPDSVIRPIFGFTSLLRLRYRKLSDDLYEFDQRESAHYTHLETGEPVGEFYNPYTDKMNYAVGYVSPLFTYHFDLGGMRSAKDDGHLGEMPYQLTEYGGHLQTTERRVSTYPVRIDEAMFPDAYSTPMRTAVDVATYRAPATQVLDVGRDFVGSLVDFSADTAWPLWMFMGDRPGMVYWLGHGAKIRETSELPADVLRRVEAVHPGFIDDPWGLDGAQYFTGPQMIALRKAGKL